MAELRITIPDAKVQLVLEAFTRVRGIGTDGEIATPAEFKAEIINEIKEVVKRYKVMRFQFGQDDSISQADIEVEMD